MNNNQKNFLLTLLYMMGFMFMFILSYELTTIYFGKSVKAFFYGSILISFYPILSIYTLLGLKDEEEDEGGILTPAGLLESSKGK